MAAVGTITGQEANGRESSETSFRSTNSGPVPGREPGRSTKMFDVALFPNGNVFAC